MPENIDLVDQIKQAMESQGVSQSELARRLGVTRAAVSYLLNKEYEPSMETATKYLEALGYELVVTSQEAPVRRRRA
jgi:transcriptional regulator with XRE-family HTH domain